MASELLLLLASGKQLNVWAWGVNEYGMNGQNTLGGGLNSDLTLLSTSVSSIGYSTARSIGYVKSNGTLWVWGRNALGTLGLNTAIDYYSSPVQLGADTNWAQISSGDIHSLFRKSNGTIWACGYGFNGELGLNSEITYSSPVQIGALTTWTFIATGPDYSFGIKGGALWAWGNNSNGQLGRNNLISYSSPVQVGALTTWSKIIAGSYTNAGLTTSGALWMWGINSSGECGNLTVIDRSSPVQVSGGGVWNSVALSANGTCGIKSDGTLWQWGQPYALVAINAGPYSSPVQVGADTNWANVYACPLGSTFLAIKSNGTAWLWGRAVPAPGNPFAPTLSSTSTQATIPSYRSSPTQIGSATNWVSASLSTSTKVSELGIFLINSSNELYSVGYNENGILGINKVYNNTYTSPVNTGLDVYLDGTCSEYNSLFVKKSNRTLWQAGAIFYPTVGASLYPNPATLYSSPIQVGVSTNWSKVFCNSGANFALTQSKDLYAWGLNTNSRLGLGGTAGAFVSNPTQISGTWEFVSQGNSTAFHNLAFKYSPITGLYGWGNNTYGQLGLPTKTNYNSPVLIANTEILKASVSYRSSGYITLNNLLYTMGDNTNGQLGANDTISRSSPVQISGLYKDISLGQFFMAAIRTNGTLWAWGQNTSGQLGQNNTTNQSSPVQVGSDTNWVKVFSGGNYWVASKSDRTLWACGALLTNASPNAIVNYSSPVQISSNFKAISGNAADNFNVVLLK